MVGIVRGATVYHFTAKALIIKYRLRNPPNDEQKRVMHSYSPSVGEKRVRRAELLCPNAKGICPRLAPLRVSQNEHTYNRYVGWTSVRREDHPVYWRMQQQLIAYRMQTRTHAFLPSSARGHTRSQVGGGKIGY